MSWYHSDDLYTVVGTGSSYVLSASDVGKQMYFEVSFTDDDGFAESVQYTGAQYVQEAPPVNLLLSFRYITGEIRRFNINCGLSDYRCKWLGGVADVSWYYADDLNFTVVGTEINIIFRHQMLVADVFWCFLYG